MNALPAQDLGDSARNAWDTTIETLPKVVLFLVILLVGWLIARALASALTKLLARVGFDRAVERGGLRQAFSAMTSTPSALLGKLVYYALLLLTLQLAFGVFGPNPISDLIASIAGYLPKIFIAIVIVVVAAAIANVVKDLIQAALGGTDLGRWLARAAQIVILFLGVVAALGQLGIAVVVTNTVLIAVLATLAGVIVVGVGGGLVRPMQRRWERWLEVAEHHTVEASRARAAVARRARIEADHPLPQPPTGATVAAAEDDAPQDPVPTPEPVRQHDAPPAATPSAGEAYGADDETQQMRTVDPDDPRWGDEGRPRA